MPPRVRVRHHVNPFRAGFMRIVPEPLALHTQRVQPALHAQQPEGTQPVAPPLEVELGCADAQFLFQLARLDVEKGTRYVGVEIRRPLVEDVNQRAQEEGLSHLHAVFAHINLNLPQVFAGHPVRRFYINFPDPWFKRQQKKRRVVTPEMVATLVDLLEPSGEVFFQSDVWDLALDAMAVLESEPRLVNTLGEWSFLRASPYPAYSLREERCTRRGEPVWRVLYRRQPSAADPPRSSA